MSDASVLDRRRDPRAVRSPEQPQRVHRRQLPRRSLSALARAARDRPGARGHRPRAHRPRPARVLPGPAVPGPSALLGVRLRGVRPRVPRHRDVRVVAGAVEGIDKTESTGVDNSMLYMNGKEHRRYRSLVQPSFVPGAAQWWSERWIDDTVHALIDNLEGEGRADLNVDFCAAIPMLTITGSFGIPIAQALDIRAALRSTNLDGVGQVVRDRAPDRGRAARAAGGRPHQRARRSRDDRRGRRDPPALRRRDLLVRVLAARRPARAPRGSRWASRLAALLARPELLDAVRERPRPAARRDRGVGAVDADRSDVLAVRGAATSSSTGWRSPRARWCTCVSAPRTATRRAGTDPTSTTRCGHRTRPSGSVAARTCASGCTWPGPRWPPAIGALLDRLPEPPARSRRRVAAASSACTNAARPRSTSCSETGRGNQRWPTTSSPISRSSGTSTSRCTARPTASRVTCGTARRSSCSRPPAGRAARPRTSALIFGRDGDDLLLVASQGGAPTHPNWYHNLSADPDVEVQVQGDVFPATARTASDDEKARSGRS